MFAQNPDGSVVEQQQQRRILLAASKADRARERTSTETEGRVAERDFIGQYNAQDQQRRILLAAWLLVTA